MFGGEFDVNTPANSSFRLAGGPSSISFSRQDITLGLKKTIDIFKVERCAIEMVKGSLEVGIKTGIVGPTNVAADFVVEGLAGILKFTYPVTPERQ